MFVMAECALALVPCRSGSTLEALIVDTGNGGLERRTYPLTANGLPCAVHGDTVYVSATDPSGDREASVIDVVALDRSTGDLEPVQTVGVPARMAHLAVHPAGSMLYGASFPESLIAAFPIALDGRLADAPAWTVETPRQPHMAGLSPDARFLHIPCMGADRVMRLSLSPDGRALAGAPSDGLAQPAGSGPRHLAWHPRLPVGYLVCELSGDVVALAYDPEAGRFDERTRVSALGDDIAGPPWASEIRVSPDGRVLYCAERRGSTLAWWRLGEDGLPQKRSIQSVPRHPRGFDITSCGRLLVLAAQGDDCVCLYEIDRETGRPDLAATVPCAAQPSFVTIVPLNRPERADG